MHVCIVGTGASGWIACNFLKNLDFIKKISIVGSSKIPTIGVGEANTLSINWWLETMLSKNEFTLSDFIKETDATIKYGVMYKNWSPNDFLHYFKNPKEFAINGDQQDIFFYGRTLANKNTKIPIHKLMGVDLYDNCLKNNLLLDQDFYLNSYHFDAGKFIDFFSKIALKNEKVDFFNIKIDNAEIKNESVFKISGEGVKIEADYYIFATGDQKINEEILKIKYDSYSNVLLTDKALFYPKQYKNKKEEFTPYTTAKTMKNGWRWITPTWSRVGTGYVFSSNHITESQAEKEFIEEIGDEKADINIINFYPKHNKKSMNKNWCSLGMASGFLEPLDAPGLNITIHMLKDQIYLYLKNFKEIYKNEKHMEIQIEKLNDEINKKFDFWATFIMLQYKTSHRNDTEFWIDNKNIFWEKYEKILSQSDTFDINSDQFMLFHTMSGKDIQWNSGIKSQPYKTIRPKKYNVMEHLEYIKKIREME